MAKICSSCHYTKPIVDFSKSKRLEYQASCKECAKAYLRVYRKNNKANLAIKAETYRQVKKEQISKKKGEWKEDNRARYADYGNSYIKNRRQIDINFKLIRNIRTRFASALDGDYKSGSAVKDLGCSIEEFKAYIESKFQPGMAWDNWSRIGWHLDHIKPLSCFDLTNLKELKEACHYSNLQPLWAIDNLRKSDKYG